MELRCEKHRVLSPDAEDDQRSCVPKDGARTAGVSCEVYWFAKQKCARNLRASLNQDAPRSVGSGRADPWA